MSGFGWPSTVHGALPDASGPEFPASRRWEACQEVESSEASSVYLGSQVCRTQKRTGSVGSQGEGSARFFLFQGFDPAAGHAADFLYFFSDYSQFGRVVIAELVAKPGVKPEFFQVQICLNEFGFFAFSAAVVSLYEQLQGVGNQILDAVGQEKFLISWKMLHHADHPFEEFVGFCEDWFF